MSAEIGFQDFMSKGWSSKDYPSMSDVYHAGYARAVRDLIGVQDKPLTYSKEEYLNILRGKTTAFSVQDQVEVETGKLLPFEREP